MVLVGTKLQHVVSLLALEIGEQQGPQVGTQVKPRDELFWFGKPEILLRLIQFIIFQVMMMIFTTCVLYMTLVISLSWIITLIVFLVYAECL